MKSLFVLCVAGISVLGFAPLAGAASQQRRTPPPPRWLASAENTANAETARPMTLLPGSSGGGYPIGGSGPSGTTIRFIDHGTFWLGLLVRNDSSAPLMLLEARTPEPVKSLVHQTGAGFSRYTPCAGNAPCPATNMPTSAAPLLLPPHAEAAIKLSYRLVSCLQAKGSTTASASSLLLTYRQGNGLAHESVPLNYGRLNLKPPAGVECLSRPKSYLGLVGSFTTSPEHQPIPGSTGDTCTKTATGDLLFSSREFMDRSGTTFRIQITLPKYRGTGSYSRGANALGRAEATAVGWFGTPGPTTVFHDPNATVIVTRARGSTIVGSLTAVFSGHRRFFRAYGTWRCTTER
jgi:hypothetical protein